jgi:dihydroorotate dehydrogenase (fumarate)
MIDLTTTYLGLKLKNPFVASSSPLTEKLETVQKMEQAGIAAIVLPSLFEEQIINESWKLHRDLDRGAEGFSEALSYLPDTGRYSIGPDRYIEKLALIKQSVKIPVFGSLNGASSGGWIDYAQKIEQAGADALELNLYDVASNPEITSSHIENSHIALVRDLRSKIKIPIAVKLSPFYTSLPNFALRLSEAGADGLVLFNRFYQPDFDLEHLQVVPNLVLSTSNELRLPLRWIAILYGRIQADLGLTTGVHDADDLIKAIMAGASATMVASELLHNGIDRIPEILADVQTWLEAHEYESIKQMKGSMSQLAVGDATAFERANYMKVLSSYY